MIDIHSHILPFVDDGSHDCDCSIEMIKESIEQGTTGIFLTPHYRNNYKLSPSQIKQEFLKFKKTISEQDISVNLYLGQEIYIDSDYKEYFAKGDIITLNQSRYVLIEYDFINEVDYAEIAYEIIRLGYVPIIAHFERYAKADISTAVEIKNMGGLIQVNAESIVGKQKRHYYKKVKKLLANGIVDFVASDVHFNRENYLLKAQNFIKKKFGEQIAQDVFVENAKKIIKG